MNGGTGPAKQSPRRLQQPRARAALIWGLLFVVVLHLGLNISLDAWVPEIYDFEFENHITELRRRVQESPDRPVLVLIGSSRTMTSFRPEILTPLSSPTGAAPIVFNFSHFGAGPIMNLVETHRLLRQGIKPRWLVLEIMPPFLADEGTSILTTRTEVRDLSVLHGYLPPGKLFGRFLRTRLNSWYSFRRTLCRHFLPVLAPDYDDEETAHHIGPLGGSNLRIVETSISPADAAHRTTCAYGTYGPPLQGFRITDQADRAMREVIELTGRHGIQVALLLSPEGSTFRSWYPPEVRTRLDAYLRELSVTYGVPVIDARGWLDDADFIDSHHVLLGGSEKFTRRLATDGLQPLVEGSLKANN